MFVVFFEQAHVTMTKTPSGSANIPLYDRNRSGEPPKKHSLTFRVGFELPN